VAKSSETDSSVVLAYINLGKRGKIGTLRELTVPGSRNIEQKRDRDTRANARVSSISVSDGLALGEKTAGEQSRRVEMIVGCRDLMRFCSNESVIASHMCGSELFTMSASLRLD
jgi:hypothetical protein